MVAVRSVGLAVALAAATGLAIGTLPITSPAEATPVESSCNTRTGGTGVSGFTSHAQLGSQLERIERTSQGRVEVEVAGTTNQGRDIWSARVGEGDRVVLIQSEIHGNEGHGTDALLRVLSTHGNNSQRSAEIREAVTVVAIPMRNADGSELDQRRNDNDLGRRGRVVPATRRCDAGVEPQHPSRRLRRRPRLQPRPRLRADGGRLPRQFVDLHGQGPCYVGVGAEDEYSPLSISGRFIADPAQFGDWPNFDYDASRRANLAVYDASRATVSRRSAT